MHFAVRRLLAEAAAMACTHHTGHNTSAAARLAHSQRLARAAASLLPPRHRRTYAVATAQVAASSLASSSSSDVNSSSDSSRVGHRKPWQQRVPFECPACEQHCFRPEVLLAHLTRCCPDLAAAQGAGPAAGDELRLRAWLQLLQARELELREAALEIAFRQKDAEGNRLRQGPAEVGTALGLPQPRAARLLAAAMRAVPLAADTECDVEVLWEDDDLVAVAKPAGVISAPKHRYTGGSMVNRVIGRLGYEPLTLHRLDQWTSGVLLFAKSREVVPAIHEQFRRRTVEKRYLALAVGVPSLPLFSVDAPIDRDERNKVARKVAPGGKPAVTDFRVLAAAPAADLSVGQAAACAAPGLLPGRLGATLVGCKPHTGRTHQIRVHLAHAGHPILGDDLYGITGPWLPRQALHAAALRLVHPRTGRPLTLRAPLPDDIASACSQLGLDCSAAEEGAISGLDE